MPNVRGRPKCPWLLATPNHARDLHHHFPCLLFPLPSSILLLHPPLHLRKGDVGRSPPAQHEQAASVRADERLDHKVPRISRGREGRRHALRRRARGDCHDGGRGRVEDTADTHTLEVGKKKMMMRRTRRGDVDRGAVKGLLALGEKLDLPLVAHGLPDAEAEGQQRLPKRGCEREGGRGGGVRGQPQEWGVSSQQQRMHAVETHQPAEEVNPRA